MMIRRLAQWGIAVVTAMLLASGLAQAPAQAQANQDTEGPDPTGICPDGGSGTLIWSANRVPHAVAWTMVNGRWRPCL